MVKNLKLFDVGYGNLISSSRVICALRFDSLPTKKLVNLARENGNLIDATCGKKTLTVLVLDTDHIVLSSLDSETICAKVGKCNGSN